ncbi:hypothetical protein CALVIDRAFT_199044 [Calocera viscosa TUFC12733]|uniref:Uncharacterized protein n=1 Tax=Calocera viscosa (strain TUFC12733) TaxID=1330018 RepID=A0A167KJS9_CALVF|nr:hypothetical protein CALVIDRAFT_199044 [Calocera viscosa TUFC12733]
MRWRRLRTYESLSSDAFRGSTIPIESGQTLILIVLCASFRLCTGGVHRESQSKRQSKRVNVSIEQWYSVLKSTTRPGCSSTGTIERHSVDVFPSIRKVLRLMHGLVTGQKQHVPVNRFFGYCFSG